MRSFLAAALAGAVSATAMDQNDFKFMRYIVEHGKEYATVEEYNMRKENFLFMDAEIARINREQTTSVHGHNFLSDWTREEYSKLMGLKNMPKPERGNGPVWTGEGLTAPTSVNWVTAGKVNAIKNQGQCGSCWAFSANASLESAHAIFYSTLPNLSEQQLVSCSSAFGNSGCNGGWYYWAWDYAVSTPITGETTYPYTSGNFGITGTCKYVSGSGFQYDLSQTDVAGNTAAMETATAQQVLSVAIEADTTTFQSYTSGTITSSACGTNIDHAVAIVGYSTTGNYWLVRNSWGTSWGMQGYVQIGMASGAGICGINQYVAYPTVKQ
jgi:KDEL-tailed cysteine endopeptidase